MGISTNMTEVGGSLPYQENMEYVKSDHGERNLNNGINTVELNFTNTQVKHADNRVAGIYQENLLSQIISNTDNNRSKHDEHQLNNNFQQNAIATIPSYLETLQAETSPTLLSPEPFIYNIADGASITSVSNITSPTMMWQDDFVDFSGLPDYELCDAMKVSKFEECSQTEELDPPPHLVHMERNGKSSGLADCMENEETFEITHENDGMILTATQEILADGISTQDFQAFQNSIFNETDVDITPHNLSDGVLAYNEDEVELGADPMMSAIDIQHNSFAVREPENRTDPPESPCDEYNIPMDMEIDETVAQQLLSLLKSSGNNIKKTEGTTIISSAPVKKKAHHNLNVVIIPSTSTAADVDTAQVVDTIFKWEDNKIVNEKPQSPLHDSSNAKSACQSPFKDQGSNLIIYEDITQTSLHSSFDGRYDGSDFGSTAPPTPYSTVSLDTPRSTERKRRGRPPKTHSAEPNPEQLEQLSSSQKRYVIQRYKNNEASRQSRLNRKNKQEQLMEEESRQYAKNLSLKSMLKKWEKKELLLKEMLRQQVKLS